MVVYLNISIVNGFNIVVGHYFELPANWALNGFKDLHDGMPSKP